MPAVEIRIAAGQVSSRMDEVRRWLRDRECARKVTSTGSRDERLVVIEFLSTGDADAFARQFSGSVVRR
jgi:hypothetical protein